VAMLGGVDIADTLRKVETLGRAGQVAEAGGILASIEGTLSAFEKRIAEIAGTGAVKASKSRKAATDAATRARRKA
jgi:hypothetical protein